MNTTNTNNTEMKRDIIDGLSPRKRRNAIFFIQQKAEEILAWRGEEEVCYRTYLRASNVDDVSYMNSQPAAATDLTVEEGGGGGGLPHLPWGLQS